jgi:hypothetical protein
VTAYHIIRYDGLIYNHIHSLENLEKKKIDELLIKNSQFIRGIDNLNVNSNFAEEYGFILGKKTGDSRINTVSLPLFIEICKKIQFISGNKKSILLKNPFDFTNFIFLHKYFPDAKIIFIHRNPIKILNSQIKALRNLLDNQSFYMTLLSPKYKKLFENKLLLYYHRFINNYLSSYSIKKQIDKLSKATNFYIKNIKLLEENNTYINIRYEDLCKSTNAELARIFKFLNIKKRKDMDFVPFIRLRKSEILGEIEKKRKYIERIIAPYFRYFNF